MCTSKKQKVTSIREEMSPMITALHMIICMLCVFIRLNLILLVYFPVYTFKLLSVSVFDIFVCYVNAIDFSLRATMLHVLYNKKKCDDIARGQFSTITETACLSGWEFEADKSCYGVYVTRHWNLMNSYWMFWIGCLREARSELARWAVSAIFEKLLSVI